MKPERFARLKELLWEASGLPEEERKAYLDQACGDDPELRRETEAILADGAAPSEILQKAGMVPDAAVEPEGDPPPIPKKIGQYTIKRVIAAGGMNRPGFSGDSVT